MWGTATVRGEEDVIVRRLNFDERFCWRSDREVDGHVMHTDEDIAEFVANDWSWMERQYRRNPDGEPLWEWYSSNTADPYYGLGIALTWDSWAFGLSYDRDYGSEYHEDIWSVHFSFGPLHFTLERTWNVK